MLFDRLVFSGHAIQRTFERVIQASNVRHVVESGDVVANYPSDKPYASRLLLGWIGDQPLHVVAALDPTTRVCYVITTYVPDPGQWSPDFRIRRIP